jgi:hypothetical protein
MSDKPITGEEAALWLVWSEEHRGYWPASRCGYVPLSQAGHFTFEEALDIVTKGNWGMGSTPQESMLPLPHPTILERAANVDGSAE